MAWSSRIEFADSEAIDWWCDQTIRQARWLPALQQAWASRIEIEDNDPINWLCEQPVRQARELPALQMDNAAPPFQPPTPVPPTPPAPSPGAGGGAGFGNAYVYYEPKCDDPPTDPELLEEWRKFCGVPAGGPLELADDGDDGPRSKAWQRSAELRRAIIERLRRLVALSGSSNANEATAAAQQVARMLREHGLVEDLVKFLSRGDAEATADAPTMTLLLTAAGATPAEIEAATAEAAASSGPRVSYASHARGTAAGMGIAGALVGGAVAGPWGALVGNFVGLGVGVVLGNAVGNTLETAQHAARRLRSWRKPPKIQPRIKPRK